MFFCVRMFNSYLNFSQILFLSSLLSCKFLIKGKEAVFVAFQNRPFAELCIV